MQSDFDNPALSDELHVSQISRSEKYMSVLQIIFGMRGVFNCLGKPGWKSLISCIFHLLRMNLLPKDAYVLDDHVNGLLSVWSGSV
jgi:hypothetical protein